MLRLINVCKSFKFGKEKQLVLDNVNLDFKKNELVFILGKSGSGKSTTLKTILTQLVLNYKPSELNPNNEREALMYQIMQYKFALIELNLHLDTHPNDKDVIELYNKYSKIKKEMCKKYESMYGPLVLGDNEVNENRWEWINSPWPWEVM